MTQVDLKWSKKRGELKQKKKQYHQSRYNFSLNTDLSSNWVHDHEYA